MVQKLVVGALGGSGIVGVLIVAGILLSITDVSQILGQIAAGSGVVIGVILGILGIIGVLSRL
jgi:hypothetical protein